MTRTVRLAALFLPLSILAGPLAAQDAAPAPGEGDVTIAHGIGV